MAVRLCINQLCLSNLLRSSNSLYFIARTVQRNMTAEHPIKDIEFGDLENKLKKQEITLIDVRQPKELKEDGKIPNSTNIPLGDVAVAFKLSDSTFQSKYGIPKPGESDVFVFSCRSGKRATNAVNIVSPLGYTNALVYLGSFNDWVKNGGAVEKN